MTPEELIAYAQLAETIIRAVLALRGTPATEADLAVIYNEATTRLLRRQPVSTTNTTLPPS